VCLTGVDYFLHSRLHTEDCGHHRHNGTEEEYARKERIQREDNHISSGEQILFLEVQVEDASELMDILEVREVEVGAQQMLRSVSSVVPNAIAAFLLHLRDTTGRRRTATSGGRRATLSYTSFATSSLEKAIPRPSPTRYRRRTNSESRHAIHVGGR
jgi:hypothetical protein